MKQIRKNRFVLVSILVLVLCAFYLIGCGTPETKTPETVPVQSASLTPTQEPHSDEPLTPTPGAETTMPETSFGTQEPTPTKEAGEPASSGTPGGLTSATDDGNHNWGPLS